MTKSTLLTTVLGILAASGIIFRLLHDPTPPQDSSPTAGQQDKFDIQIVACIDYAAELEINDGALKWLERALPDVGDPKTSPASDCAVMNREFTEITVVRNGIPLSKVNLETRLVDFGKIFGVIPSLPSKKPRSIKISVPTRGSFTSELSEENPTRLVLKFADPDPGPWVFQVQVELSYDAGSPAGG